MGQQVIPVTIFNNIQLLPLNKIIDLRIRLRNINYRFICCHIYSLFADVAVVLYVLQAIGLYIVNKLI